jgi:hypothetical protein
MSLLLQAFWQVVSLRRSPQIIPRSRRLLGVMLLFHLLIGAASASYYLPLGDALLVAGLGTLLLAAISHLLLAFYGVAQRSVQVITALAGCELFLGLVSLPLDFWFSSVSKADAAFPALLSLLLLGWNIAVVAHVYRHALEVSKGLGFLYATGYMLVSITLASLF